jgi:hypothetical protein
VKVCSSLHKSAGTLDDDDNQPNIDVVVEIAIKNTVVGFIVLQLSSLRQIGAKSVAMALGHAAAAMLSSLPGSWRELVRQNVDRS